MSPQGRFKDAANVACPRRATARPAGRAMARPIIGYIWSQLLVCEGSRVALGRLTSLYNQKQTQQKTKHNKNK